MLEKIDLSKKIDKKEYKKIKSDLDIKLGELQRQARDLKIPIIIIFEGWDAAGKGTFINELIMPLDPRGFNVYSIIKETEEEKFKPFLWRYWTKTPAKGRIAIFDRSWYRRVFNDRIDGNIKHKDWEIAFDDIKAFEQMLAEDGNVIIKFFLHIDKKEQKKRFKVLEDDSDTSWRVTKLDKKHHKKYNETIPVIDNMIEKTDTEYAAWTIVETVDKNFATIKIFSTIAEVLGEKIELIKNPVTKPKITVIHESLVKTINSSILDKVDMTSSLSEAQYKKILKDYQEKIRRIEYKIYSKRIPIMIMYEGWDAAGKGGNIKRLTQNLDPRGYQVIPISAPNDIEKAHHYLWRFWMQLPKAGHITIFDRTWYGRVLVERVEGFCSESEWKRSYKEINETEEHLANFGTVIIKFWLQIDKEEQLRRFNERQQTTDKQWKITEEDWRNREKWDAYKDAVDEMLFRTSTTYAPWTIIEANDKYWARIKTLKTLIEAAEKAFDD